MHSGFPFFRVMWLYVVLVLITGMCNFLQCDVTWILDKLMSLLSLSSIKYALFLKLLVFPAILVGANLILFAGIKVVLATQIQVLLKRFAFSREYLTVITSSEGRKISQLTIFVVLLYFFKSKFCVESRNTLFNLGSN